MVGLGDGDWVGSDEGAWLGLEVTGLADGDSVGLDEGSLLGLNVTCFIVGRSVSDIVGLEDCGMLVLVLVFTGSLVGF